MYLENPTFRDSDNYEPWPGETDMRFASLLSLLTYPTHIGMLERADPHGALQEFMESDAVSESNRVRWEHVLDYYDIAMAGKRSALLALGASHDRIRELRGEALRLDSHKNALDRERRDLERKVESLETEMKTQLQQIKSLEHRAQEASRREIVYDRTRHQQEQQQKYLEAMIANWDAPPGAAATQEVVHDTRFMEVKDGLQKAQLQAYTTKQRCAQLEGKNNNLKILAEEVSHHTIPYPRQHIDSDFEC
jgi:hypothetical protein